jgi:hypothetical protein
LALPHSFSRTSPRPSIDLKDILNRPGFRGFVSGQGHSNNLGNAGEKQPAIQECGDGHLVGSVQHSSRGASRPACLVAERKTGK